MNLADIDRYCDLFERQIKRGDELSAEQFRADQRLPADDALVAELQKLEGEYRQRPTAPAATLVPHLEDVGLPTVPMPVETTSQVIGPYKLLQKLGEGGMGVVYMAEQTLPVARRVALKIIKPGMDSWQVIARFEAERQALSLMDHPNIARVLDAGTTETGLPYFVMELVKGIPITRYCDEQRLSPRERLELFVPICLAVQHAHQKGIIHRDIKPSNILVAQFDDRPVPKIIDFGLAKAVGQQLTEHTLFTQIGQIVGTIAYMSPEQASFNQLDIDTRTDVYALGVLLYELLTGETPFDKQRLHSAAFDELLRIIRQEEPPRPSVRLSSHESLPTIAANRKMDPQKLSVLVRGELDWIVMRALEKDRVQRYESANGLAMDVQRYLADEPVSACPPSALYRLKKLARRHRAVVGAGVAVATALLVGLIGTTWQAVRATLAESDLTTQRDRAKTKEAEAVSSLQRAEKAEIDLRETLWQSLLDQARARRASGQMGRRFESLAALKLAAAIRPSVALRNEAIASMALMDLRVDQAWDFNPGSFSETPALFFDSSLERYVCSDAQGNLSLRSAHDDRELLRLPGNGIPAGGAIFSPDRQYLAVHYQALGTIFDNLVRVWRLDRGEITLELASKMMNRAMDFSPDGSHFAVGHQDCSIRIYTCADGKLVHELTPGVCAEILRYDPQGRRLALCGRGEKRVEIRDLADGQLQRTFTFPPAESLWDMTWRPDGAQLAMSYGNRVALGDVRTGYIEKWLEGHPYSVVDHLAYNHAGSRLVSSSWDGRFVVWDVASQKSLLTAYNLNQRGWGKRFQFSADDQRLAYNLTGSQIQLWNVKQSRELLQLTGSGKPGVAFHPAGRLLVLLDAVGLRVWDFAQNKFVGETPLANCWSAEFHPSGDSLVMADSSGIYRWPFHKTETERGDHRELGPPSQIWTGQQVNSVTFSSDGSRLAAGRQTGHGVVLDWQKPSAELALNSHTRMSSISFSPDGKRVATGTWKGSGVVIWDAATGRSLRQLPGISYSASVAFSPDGRWLGTSEAGIFRIWNVAAWEVAQRIDWPGSEVPGAIAFAPDGAIVALGVANGAVRLVRLPSGEELATLAPPEPRPLEMLRFSPDGCRLAACGSGMVHVWDLRAVRAELGNMGLDWNLPTYIAPLDSADQAPLDVEIVPGSMINLAMPKTSTKPLDADEVVQRLAEVTQTPLAFSSSRSGNLDIYLADPGTMQLVNRSQHPAKDSAPEWSPDGTQIAFESNRRGNYDLFVMNSDGSGLRQLTSDPADDRSPDWSPDGKRLCFKRHFPGKTENLEVCIINVDGTGERNITNHPSADADPSWSPTGDRIAFGSTRIHNQWMLHSMSPDGDDVRLLRRAPTGWFVAPAWSPTGREMAFTATFVGSRHIYLTDADGRNEKQLSNLNGLSTLATWSRDGTYIAFLYRNDDFPPGKASLYVMRADGTDLREIAPFECSINDGRPAWKP